MRKPVQAICEQQKVKISLRIRTVCSLPRYFFLLNPKFQDLELVSVVEKASLNLTWSHTPGTGFLVTRLKYMYTIFSFFLLIVHSVMSDHDGRYGCGFQVTQKKKKNKKKITIQISDKATSIKTIGEVLTSSEKVT